MISASHPSLPLQAVASMLAAGLHLPAHAFTSLMDKVRAL